LSFELIITRFYKYEAQYMFTIPVIFYEIVGQKHMYIYESFNILLQNKTKFKFLVTILL